MSLQVRLSALITAIGADYKHLRDTATILWGLNSISNTEQPGFAVEWRDGGPGGSLLAKLVELNPIVNSVVVDRSELWLRTRSRAGGSAADRKFLDSDGVSDFIYLSYGTYAARPAATASSKGWAYYATDTTALYVNLTGAAWKQIAGPQEANTITTPSTGFANNYINYNNTFRYWKDPDGIVHCVGEFNDAGVPAAVRTANAIIWDGFPAGYRPAVRSYFSIETNVAGATNHILINTSGQIRVSDNYGTNPGAYSNLGHITFPTF